MDPLREIAARHGVFLTSEAYHLGYDKRAIARAVRGGAWHRVRRGAFVPNDAWLAADAVARHRILAAAVHRSYGDRVAFSHVTAAILLGIDVWGFDLSRVHVTRRDTGAGRGEPDVVHHVGLCLDANDVVRVDGRLVANPIRAAIEAGTLVGSEAALVILDSGLHRGVFTSDELASAFDTMQHWPSTRHLHIPVRMADHRAESVGESRSRWLFWKAGLPAPDLQVPVYDVRGRLLGTNDFRWRGLLGEFDGRMKYGRLLRPGQDPGEVVFAEKQREDDMRRATGATMVRIIWVDLDRPQTTASRVRVGLGQRADGSDDAA